MNPDLPLDEGNIIPQCQICNRPGRNKWIYDKTGRVIEVANTEDGTRIVEKFIDNAPNETIEKLFQLLKERLKK